MRSFFRRKTFQASPSATQSFDTTGPFSPDHVFMAAWLEVPVQSVLADCSPEFAKLRAWLAKHPSTHVHLQLRLPIAGPSSRHSECVLYALKSQILQAFDVLAECEKLLNASRYIQAPARPDHPFPAGRDLRVVARTWGDLLRWYACLAGVEAASRADHVRVASWVAAAQAAVAPLIALLASADAVPAPHVPVVLFDGLGLRRGDVAGEVERLAAAARQGSRCLLAMGNASSSIANMAFAYAKGGLLESPELQMQRLHEFVAHAADSFDDSRSCMAADFDAAPFADHFMHPESMAHPIMAHFHAPENRTPAGFAEFIRVIVRQCNFTDPRRAAVVNAVVAQAFAPQFAPQIQFDGPGTLDCDALETAIELVAIDDPIWLLAAVGDPGRAAGAGEAVAGAAQALAAVTSAGASVLRFAYDFTLPQYLTERQRAVRAAIADFLRIGG
jgi:hypothetical protein